MTFKKIIEIISNSAKIGKHASFIIACISWVVLAIPEKLSKALKIYDLIEKHKTFLSAIAIIFTLYFFFHAIYVLLSSLISKLLKQYKIKKLLKNLTKDEKQVLKVYISCKKRAALFPKTTGPSEGLVKKGILYRTSNEAYKTILFNYNIVDYVYDYLLKHNKLID